MLAAFHWLILILCTMRERETFLKKILKRGNAMWDKQGKGNDEEKLNQVVWGTCLNQMRWTNQTLGESSGTANQLVACEDLNQNAEPNSYASSFASTSHRFCEAPHVFEMALRVTRVSFS